MHCIAVFASFALLLTTASALECYVCTNQEQNDDKCTKTVNTCQVDQTVCLSKVSWRYPDYWTPGGRRIHSISKGCDNNSDCNRKRDNNKLHCKRDWWNDWTCYQCCNGDRCNYYVTLAGTTLQPQLIVLLTAVIVCLSRWFH